MPVLPPPRPVRLYDRSFMPARIGSPLLRALASVAPGTALREGLDRILQAKMGALIVVGDGQGVLSICSGGFLLDAEYSPQRLSELAKMDGAIILSADASRIARANVHLLPDPRVPTVETGTRHRTAERAARVVNGPVISISEEMSVITVYQGEHKQQLAPIGRLIDRASQALQTLGGYRTRLDALTGDLSRHEVDDLVTVRDVVVVLQRCEMVRRIGEEIASTIVELGSEGRLVQLQLEELLGGVDRIATLVLRDYVAGRSWEDGGRTQLAHLSTEELLELGLVARVFGLGDARERGERHDRHDRHDRIERQLHAHLVPRGYRLLARIPRMADNLVENVATHFASLPLLLSASIADLTEVEGVGDVRARAIRDGLRRVLEGVATRPR